MRQNRSAYTLPFPASLWCFTLLLLVVHFLLTFEEKKPIGFILSNWGYYRAMLFSLSVSLVLICWVRYQSIKLDKKVAWIDNFHRRLQLQLLSGMLLPLLLTVVLATFYFAILQVNILDTVYFRRHLPLIGIFLFVFNLLVLVWHLYFKRRPYLNVSKMMVVERNPGVGANIACVYIKDGQCFYYDLKGQYFVWTSTLKDAISQLGGEQFFEVRRGFLLNRTAIADVKPHGTTLKITLFFDFAIPIVVSHRNLADFKHWLVR